MEKITTEMRDKLREPLPDCAVAPHPTKPYLSSIKSIYVVERINDVFGIGSWTLKSTIEERLEKFVVVKAILEIPEYGFYGEAYGGNDNADIGDAYKGAVTDGFTKIAGQQLEIGIDVFKGLAGKTEKPVQKTTQKTPPGKPATTKETTTPSSNESPSSVAKAPSLKNIGELYTRAAKFGLNPQDVLAGAKEAHPEIRTQEDITDFDEAWRATAKKFASTIKAQESNKVKGEEGGYL